MRWINSEGTTTSNSGSNKSNRRRPLPRWIKGSIRITGLLLILSFAVVGPISLWGSGSVFTLANTIFMFFNQNLADAGLRAESVILQGHRYETSKKITEVLQIKRDTPMLSIDLIAARSRLEALPWIRVASVEREFPSTVRVRIVERRPLALWQRKNQLVLVDDEGIVITSQNLERFHNLLILVGKDAPKHAVSLITMLAREPDLQQRVNAAVRVGARRWNIRMDNGIFVRLPENRAQDAWHRLATLERKHKLLKQDLLSIDLRIPDHLIVRTRAGQLNNEHKVNNRRGKRT
ncbi:MAG: cell division protein FtsQ/DivIB [Pseudomonadota bacterium]|nr:cell division protein FtsQ/DivIB [Pseudomonadota bacterium]